MNGNLEADAAARGPDAGGAQSRGSDRRGIAERRPPPFRPLQVYAFDPSLELQLDMARVNRATLRVPWEDGLLPGPLGQYLEVVDVDPPSRCVYEPVDLNDPYLLAGDGLAPSEGNPQFHQQMVYAVAMKTIANFEQALGRSVQWSPRARDAEGEWLPDEEAYVPRLRIYPHALREANAYYSPEKKSLLMGYFNAQNTDARQGLPGGMVFTCLSHDVVAHETTHAILDGIHRRLLEPSNPDVLAFHEAFADLVAIFQHFTLPGVLENQIALARGDLETENLLGSLAVQFGRATNRGGALRDAMGETDPQTGRWRRRAADPFRIGRTWEPHARGALLVAAVLDAFLAIYRSHTADLLRIATSGTGVLPAGNLHPDLVSRLAEEAGKVSQRLLTICIRALDYLPPVDVTFGDYLRAMITIDADFVPEDDRHYRAAIIGAFRDWGIYPHDVRTLSVESLRWNPPQRHQRELLESLLPPAEVLGEILRYSTPAGEVVHRDDQPVSARAEGAAEQAADDYSAPRGKIAEQRRMDFLRERKFAAKLHQMLVGRSRRIAEGEPRKTLRKSLGIDLFAEDARFMVQAVRPTTRSLGAGRTKTELLVIMTQQRAKRLQPSESMPAAGDLTYRFRGGCTLLVDPDSGAIRYAIGKDIGSANRQSRQEEYLRQRLAAEGLDSRALYGVSRPGDEPAMHEPFRMLHRGNEQEDWL